MKIVLMIFAILTGLGTAVFADVSASDSSAVSGGSGNYISDLAEGKLDSVCLLVGLGGLLLATFILGMLTTYLLFFNRNRTKAGIMDRLPLRYFVIDQDSKILQYNLGDNSQLFNTTKKLCSIEDLPSSEANEQIHKLLPEVLKDGVKRSVDFSFNNTKRSGFMVKLPYDLFRREAVVWISQDTTELQNTKENFQNLAENYQLTLNSIGEAVLTTDRDGRVTMLNPVAEQLTGWTSKEAKGRQHERVFKFISYKGKGKSPVSLAISTGQTTVSASHNGLLAKDGTVRHIASSFAPLRDSAGAISGAILVFRDITEEYKQQEQIKLVLEHEEKLNTELQDLLIQHQLLLDIMPIYVYAEDANDNFRHVFCNRICSDLWGRPIEDVMGKNDAELFGDSEEVRRFQETDAAVVESGELHESIQPFTGMDGKRHMGRFFRKGIDLSGGRRWMFGLVVDITEEYEQRARLAASVSIFEYAFDLTQSAYFRFDPVTKEMTGAKLLGELWPIKDGRSLPDEEVVYPEDLEKFTALGNDLLAGKCETATVDYRSEYFGEMRYYRIKVGLSQEPYGNKSVIGVIQDITEIQKNILKLQESLALQDIIVNSLPTIFFAKNANDNFKYVLVNHALAKFLDKSPDELLGKTDKELNLEVESGAAVMDMPDGAEFELRLPAPDGIMHTFQVIEKPFNGPHGERLLLGVASDITELSELNASQETLNFCLSGLLSGENMFDPKAVLKAIGQRLNADNCSLLRFDLEKQIGYFDANWQASGDADAALSAPPLPFSDKDPWFRYISSGEIIFAPDVDDPATVERFGLWPDENKRLHLKSLYSMLINVDGKPWGNFWVGYHSQHILNEAETAFFKSAGSLIGLILQRKKYQEQIHFALQEAQSATKAKSYFLASMSHEIRTPLNAVIGFAELLKDGNLPVEEQKDYLASISSAGNTLLALINDVLDLSKLEAGQMVFNLSETNFANVVSEVGNIFRQKCEEKKLNFVADVQKMPSLWLDKLRIRQILFNLIGNAVKFTNDGEIKVSASFTVETEDSGTFTFSVADTGIGISPEDQKNLFQMFVQSEALRGTQISNSGTGLGLAIVQRMLERMNGSINLESEVGQGSKFIISIRDVKFKEVV